ncbi:MAG: ABC transporter ATP-binding protein, partial [Acetobacteraceae bacterium]
MPLIAATDLRAGYAAGDVLQGVSIEVNEAEIVGVLGRNGVGKTTLMRTLIGLLSARSGAIRFCGNEVTQLKPNQRARLGIGYVPQGRDIFPRMSVVDNLRMGGFIRGARAKPRLDLVQQYFPFLRERAHQIGGTLSGGQQEMLAIARALAGQPV